MRIPRPKGTTQVALRQHDTIQHVLNHYILNDLTLHGKRCSIPEISNYLKIPEKEIFKELNKNELSKAFSPNRVSQSLRVAKVNGFFNMLGTLNTIKEQVALLSKSQGEGYKPFVSKEYNTSLKLLLDANKGLQDLIKLLEPTENSNINIVQNQAQVHNSVSTHEALNLIEKKEINTLYEKEDMVKAMEKKYLSDPSIPNVIANEQDTIPLPKPQSLNPKALNPKSQRRRDRDTDIIPNDEIGDDK